MEKLNYALTSKSGFNPSKHLKYGMHLLALFCCVCIGSAFTTQKTEVFEDFIIKFSVEEKFQLSRVQFPLRSVIMDMDGTKELVYIQKETWEHLDLRRDPSTETRRYDKYKTTTVVNKSEAMVQYRGIDNGIYVDFVFALTDGEWYLVKIENAST